MTFDGDGKLVVNIEGSSDDRGLDIDVQLDGKIVAAGYARISFNAHLTLVRCNQDGTLDTTFDGDGKLRMQTFAQQFPPNAGVVVHENGKIGAVGETDPATPAFSMVRFNADGTSDLTFGGIAYGGGIAPAGIAKTFFGESNDQSRSILIQPDGKILVSGIADQYISIARYNSDGTLDNSFGDRGRKKIIIFTSNFTASANRILLQPDGKILLAGHNATNTTSEDFCLVRLNPNGSLDTSFDGDGFVTTNFSGSSRDIAYGAALQTDGKIVLVGKTELSSNSDFAIVRYNADGSLDSSFDGDGKVVYNPSTNTDEARNLIIQADGKILVGGTYSNVDFSLFRLNQNGSLDTSFNGTGLVTTDIINFSSDYVTDFIRQSDGKLLLLGGRSDTSFAMAMVRYNPNGSIDSTFGNNGRVIRPFDVAWERAESLALQQNGKIVISGRAGFSTNTKFCIYRYNLDGSPDMTFGDNGRLIMDLNPTGNDEAFAAAIQSNGKILIAGYLGSTFVGDYAILRFTGDSVSGSRTPFDFDGDSKTDLSIFRPAPGEWWINRSSTGSTFAAQFGSNTDRIVPADYTGDGKTDVAFWRPSTGQWFILRSEDSSFYAFPFGTSSDVPVPADYDGDGKADAAVFRESSLTWFINKSSGGTDIIGFGTTGDKPVVADYDGDGKADIAIYRPNGANGSEWWIRRSSNGSVFATQFGTPTDKPVQGDFTGDGKADVAFWRPSNGNWFVLRSEDFSFFAFPFGANGDIPVAGDYDGDGKFDAGVFRPTNLTWFIQRSTAGTLIQQFGANGDLPTPNAFIP